MDKNTTNLAKLSIDEMAEEASEENCLKWGLPLVDIYKISLKFYKGKFFIAFLNLNSTSCCEYFRQIRQSCSFEL